MSPHDLELGRLAIAWGWVSQAAAAEVHRRGQGSQQPLAQQFVAAGLLRPEQVQALEASLTQSRQTPPSGFGAVPSQQANLQTAYTPPPGAFDANANTVQRPPPGLDTTAYTPPADTFDANANTVQRPPPGLDTTAYTPPPGAFDANANTVQRPPPGFDTTAYTPPPGAFDANANTVQRPPPGFDPRAGTVPGGPPGAYAPPPAASDSQRMFDSSAGGALPQVGDVVEGGYRVEALLGKGGMGAVYRASDEAGKPVALKFILPNKDPSGSMQLRFQREAEAMARIGKVPGIVPVHRAGQHAGCSYMAMGLIEGGDLMQRVKAEGPLTVEHALEVMADVSSSIHGCHQSDVLHRDLKPANVLLRAEDGKPFVTDFGLALIDGDSAPVDRLTKTGELMGTPAFMPPEQADGDKTLIGPRTDIYSLGALLFYLVCGKAPFEGGQLQILNQLFRKDPPTLTQARGGRPVPPDLEVIVAKAMAKDPAGRYATAEDLAEDLRRLRSGEPITARAPSRMERFRWRMRQRDPRAIGMVLGAGTALIGVAVVLALVISSLLAGSAEADFEAWVSALPEAVEQRVAPGKRGEAFDLQGLREDALATLSVGVRVSPEPEGSPTELHGRLEALQQRLSADHERLSRSGEGERDPQVLILNTALEQLTLLRLCLELERGEWAERPLAQAWTFAEAEPSQGDLFAAVAQLGYQLDAESPEARCQDVAPNKKQAALEVAKQREAHTFQALVAQRPAALAALERISGADDRWAEAARRTLLEVKQVDDAVSAAHTRQFADKPGTEVPLVPSKVAAPWTLTARTRRHALAPQALRSAMEGLLEEDFAYLMQNADRLWRVHEVLTADARLPLDPEVKRRAGEQLIAFMNEHAEELQDTSSMALIGDFAKAYSASWGGEANVAWKVILEIRSWLVKKHVAGEDVDIDMLLASIRLGYGYGRMLSGAAADFVERFARAPSNEHSGDFFLLWGMLLEMIRKNDEEVATKQEVAERFAAALGPNLAHVVYLNDGQAIEGELVAEDDVEVTLRVAGSDERTFPRAQVRELVDTRERLQVGAPLEFKVPLSPIWIKETKRKVYHHTLKVAFSKHRSALARYEDYRKREDPRAEDELERLSTTYARGLWILGRYADLALADLHDSRDLATQLRSLGRAIGEMQYAAQYLPPHHGLRYQYLARFFPLSDGAREVSKQIVERLTTNATAGGVGATEELWSASTSAVHTVRLISHLALEECVFLNDYGRDHEALRRAQAHLELLSEAFPGDFPYALSALTWGQARRLNLDDVARSVCERALEAELPAHDDMVQDAVLLRDQFRGWLAVLALQADDTDAARGYLDASLAKGHVGKDVWSDTVLEQLGTSRAEVDAQLGGK